MSNYYTLEPTQQFQSTAYDLWHPFQQTNKKIVVNTSTTSNWNYRQNLQKNANNIMKYNSMSSINESGNNPYTVKNTDSIQKTPHLYKSIHDNNNPLYGFNNSDLKQNYMTKQKIHSRMIAPTIPTNY
jgi:hypothetical protein